MEEKRLYNERIEDERHKEFERIFNPDRLEKRDYHDRVYVCHDNEITAAWKIESFERMVNSSPIKKDENIIIKGRYDIQNKTDYNLWFYDYYDYYYFDFVSNLWGVSHTSTINNQTVKRNYSLYAKKDVYIPEDADLYCYGVLYPHSIFLPARGRIAQNFSIRFYLNAEEKPRIDWSTISAVRFNFFILKKPIGAIEWNEKDKAKIAEIEEQVKEIAEHYSKSYEVEFSTVEESKITEKPGVDGQETADMAKKPIDMKYELFLIIGTYFAVMLVIKGIATCFNSDKRAILLIVMYLIINIIILILSILGFDPDREIIVICFAAHTAVAMWRIFNKLKFSKPLFAFSFFYLAISFLLGKISCRDYSSPWVRVYIDWKSYENIGGIALIIFNILILLTICFSIVISIIELFSKRKKHS